MNGSMSSALRWLLRRVLRPDNGSPRPVPYRIDSIRQAALLTAFGEFNGILSGALTLRYTGNGTPSLKGSYPGRNPRQIQIVVMCVSSVARRPICIHARVLFPLPFYIAHNPEKARGIFETQDRRRRGTSRMPSVPRLIAMFAVGRLLGFIDSR